MLKDSLWKPSKTSPGWSSCGTLPMRQYAHTTAGPLFPWTSCILLDFDYNYWVIGSSSISFSSFSPVFIAGHNGYCKDITVNILWTEIHLKLSKIFTLTENYQIYGNLIKPNFDTLSQNGSEQPLSQSSLLTILWRPSGEIPIANCCMSEDLASVASFIPLICPLIWTLYTHISQGLLSYN